MRKSMRRSGEEIRVAAVRLLAQNAPWPSEPAPGRLFDGAPAGNVSAAAGLPQLGAVKRGRRGLGSAAA